MWENGKCYYFIILIKIYKTTPANNSRKKCLESPESFIRQRPAFFDPSCHRLPKKDNSIKSDKTSPFASPARQNLSSFETEKSRKCPKKYGHFEPSTDFQLAWADFMGDKIVGHGSFGRV